MIDYFRILDITIGPPPNWGGDWWYQEKNFRVAYGNGCSIELPEIGIGITSGNTTDFYAEVTSAGKNKSKLLKIFWKFVFQYFQNNPKEFTRYLDGYWRIKAQIAFEAFSENDFELRLK